MRRSLSYADAVRTLGGTESVLAEFLDRVSAVGLLTVGGINFAAVCREFIRLGEKLLSGLGEQVLGLDRTTRTERLRAAHTAIVITAYFDTLGEALSDLLPGRAVRVTAGEQVSVAGGRIPEPGWRDLAQSLITVKAPWPAPPHSYESMLRDVDGFYRDLATSLMAFVSGLAIWDELSETERDRFAERLDGPQRSMAVGRYEELFRRLAADCPEFGVWANLSGHQATRSELRVGLAGLEDLLRAMACGQVPDQRRAALARAYRAALEKPITPAGENTAELRVPSLGEGYVDHRFRVAEVSASSQPGRESWWDEVPVRDDACRFFAGYLTSPRAWEAPLIVLGQPGSGKSVITCILAARLPASDFLPVRVELRQVPAEADLQSQIEQAIRTATGEQLSWPRLVESGGGALPVILLDGFDELLQATGVTQTDFLMRVMAFQEREADQGRPLAVIVTSRTSVIDRASIPGGTAAVRLEPFDDDQVTAWLEVWHRSNAEPLAARGLRPLPASTALAHRELAEQPLLLLMLALYDADANALQRKSAELGRTELYGRLLKDFAERELLKHAGALPDNPGQAAETELLRLSVIAFAMFSRRSQWVSGTDLDTDLSALLGTRSYGHRHVGLRAPLTAAQLAVGRFFFVLESQATSDGRRLQTYEFLHATFGEFLVARLVAKVLADMAARETALVPSPFRDSPDDGLLHALLSFAVLTARGPVIAFLTDLLDQISAQQRLVLADLLVRLHARALYPRTESAYDSYHPRPLTVTARHAAWSANLVILAVLTAGEITGSQLFPNEAEPAEAWRSQAMMWRAQLAGEESSGLYEAIAFARVWVGDRRDFRLLRDDGTFIPPPTDINWTQNVPPGRQGRAATVSRITDIPRNIQRRANFTCGAAEAAMTHALQPLGVMTHVFIHLPENRVVSAANALMIAIVEPHENQVKAGSAYLDLAQVVQVIGETSGLEGDYGVYLKTALAVLLSAVQQGTAPRALLEPIASVMAKKDFGDRQLTDLLVRLHGLIVGPEPSP
jgi:hypothetical protein